MRRDGTSMTDDMRSGPDGGLGDLLRRTAPFSDLPEPLVAALAASAVTVEPDRNGCVFARGRARRGLFLRQDLASHQNAGGLAVLAPHTITSDAVWADAVMAIPDSRVVVLDDALLRGAYLDEALAFLDCPDFEAACALQARLSAMLRRRSQFTSASDDLLRDMETSLPVLSVEGGGAVFRAGDRSDAMMIVLAGMLRPRLPGAAMAHAAGTMPVDPVAPGNTVGEIGLVLDEPRRSDLIAIRDSELLVIGRDDYQRLLRRHPDDMNRILCGAIHRNLSATIDADGQGRMRTLAIVPLGAPDSASQAARLLLPAFEALGRVGPLDHRDGEALADFSHGIGTAQLAAIEQTVDLLVYIADGDNPAWTDLCLRQADHVLLVAASGDDPGVRPVEARLNSEPGLVDKTRSLLLLHDADAPRPSHRARWQAPRPGLPLHHLRHGNDGDAGRVARLLTGRAIGLVLGGGGARGFAHIGVLRALIAAGIPIDVIGGNSMGALIAAQYAMGTDPDSVLAHTRRFAKGGEFPTLPIISLVSGRRVARDLRRMFGETLIEDLWLPLFTVSCDITSASVRVHDHGSLYEAVLASNSPAGLLPPMVKDGHLLIDGAVLNNVPADVMRHRIGRGRVIAVDVNAREDLAVDPALTRLSPVDALRRIVLRQPRLPVLGDILMRAGIVGGIAHRDRVKADADLYFEPPVSGYPLMAYGQAEAIAAVGETTARALFAGWRDGIRDRGDT